MNAMCVLRGRQLRAKKHQMNTLSNKDNLATPATDTQAPAVAKKVSSRIEAYGMKGMKNVSWRRTFESTEKLQAWCEKHDAVVFGTRSVE